MSESSSIDEEASYFMFNTIFLPRKLPGSLPDQSKLEGNFLKLTVETLNDFYQSHQEISELSLILLNFKKWLSIQSTQYIDESKLHSTLNTMEINSSLFIYLRGQNCSLEIQRKDSVYIMTGFQASCSNNEIYKTDKDLCQVYPEFSFKINDNSLIKSLTLANYLTDLCNSSNQISVAKASKKGCQTEELRDAFRPTLVFDWFIFVCCSYALENFYQITKKYRDEVISDRKLFPFRRSGMWTSIKVFLNLQLEEKLGKNKGKALYKILIILAHLYIGRKIQGNLEKSFEIIQKLSKRLKKLQIFHEFFPDIINEIVLKVFEFVSSRRLLMQNCFDEIIKESKNLKCKIDHLKFNSDKTKHNFTSLINTLNQNNPTNPWKNNESSDRYFERIINNKEIPDSNIFESCSIYLLYDFENWVKTFEDESSLIKIAKNSLKIFSLFQSYIKAAKKQYEEDPVGYSRLVLTSCGLLRMLDYIAKCRHPIYSEHNSGLNTKLFESLLLPNKDHFQYAQSLYSYFFKRNQAEYPDLLETNLNNPNLFALRYKNISSQHSNLKRKLKDLDDELISQKYYEALEKINEYQEIVEEANNMECEFIKKKHKNKCEKCKILKNADNLQVEIYEKLLPEKEEECDLVVFELIIPLAVAVLRDALFVFYLEFMNLNKNQKRIKELWLNLERLSEEAKDYKPLITLGSTSKPFLSCHYSKLMVKNNNDPYDYIKPNGLNLFYSTNRNILRKPDYFLSFEININCTFQVEGFYKNLYWAIIKYDNSENQIIAKQSYCPKEITKKEYLKFCLFLSEDNLRFYNLLDALETRILSLKHESVFYLICQCLWQVLEIPYSDSGTVYPEDFSLFNNEKYLNQLQISVSSILETCLHNWNDNIVLANLIAVMLLVISVTDNFSYKRKFIEMLLNARKISIEWQGKIENFLQNSSEIKENDALEMNGKLLEIACISVFTYFVDPSDFSLVLNSSDDVLNLLWSLSRIKNHSVLQECGNSPYRKKMIAWATFISHQLESHLIKTVNINKTCLFDYLKQKWPSSEISHQNIHFEYIFEKYCFIGRVFLSSSYFLVTIGLDGAFLLNNQPIGKLSTFFTQHKLFQRLFKKTDFDIYPSNHRSNDLQSVWLNISENLRVSYSFSSHSRDEQLINIKETQDKNGKIKYLELVPHFYFTEILPKYLINHYSHWFNRSKNIIIFRLRRFEEKDFFLKKFFKIDLNSQKVEELETGRFLIDIKSSTFSEIYRKFGYKLEKPENIHLFSDLSSKDLKITAEFVRFGLSFELIENEIFSKEFRGMRISENQFIGTLIGLKKGLVLTDSKEEGPLTKKKLLVPHGNLEVLRRKNHQEVDIEIDSLRKPSFFIYEIDFRVKILRAGESINAWLYLSHLHAVTSSLLPDPFLTVTGTARALQILQSPVTFSCVPLDDESYSTLLSISKLSPKRLFIPENLKQVQTINWPQKITSFACHDAFYYLCKNIVNDSNRLSFLHEKIQDSIEINENFKDLHSRAYRKMISADYLLDSQYECLMVSYIGDLFHLETFGKGVNCNKESVKNVRKVVSQRFSPGFKVLDYFKDKKSILGVRKERIKVKRLADWIKVKNEFYEVWIELFRICRKCSESEKFEVLFGLSFLAFCGINLDLILILSLVLNHQESFPNTEYLSESYEDLSCFDIDRNRIYCFIFESAISLNEYHQMCLRSEYKSFYKQLSLDEIEENFHEKLSIISERLIDWLSKGLLSLPDKQSLICVFDLITVPFGKKILTIKQLVKNSTFIETLFLYLSNLNKNLIFYNFLNEVDNNIKNLPNFNDFPLNPFLINHFPEKQFFSHSIPLSPSPDQSKTTQEKIQEAEEIFNSGKLSNYSISSLLNESTLLKTTTPEFPLVSTSDCALEAFLIKDLKSSWEFHHNSKPSSSKEPSANLQENLQTLKILYTSKLHDYESLLNSLFYTSSPLEQLLKLSMIHPSITPTLIRKVILNQEIRNLHKTKSIYSLCGAICVLSSLDQQVDRCLLSSGKNLLKELENSPFSWSPSSRPAWLVLQMELDMMIRQVQVEVANSMILPGSNSITQLNMGEGKTSLIIPMVVLALADGKSIVRLTVLKSLFNMNKRALIQKFGGVLNKRVYVIPFTRHKNFSLKNVEIIQQVLKECLENKGVLICLPEHRLSFSLKILEICRKGFKLEKVSEKMMKVENWLREKSRDVLDECDEILSPKYQLIYTTGKESQVFCGRLRWLVSQAVLDLAKKHFLMMKLKYGDDVISLQMHSHPLAYPYFRMLKLDAYQDLCSLIFQDIVQGKAKQINFFQLKVEEIKIVSEFVLEQNPSSEVMEKVQKIMSKDSESFAILTILRGLFAFQVLFSGFSKRWRVNYGVNSRGKYLRQAVPFRAKDLPADRAQFAQTDLAILLTQLSYYYSGLDSTQLDEVFSTLLQEPDPCHEYSSWMQFLPETINNSIKSLSTINLCDSFQKSVLLYPILRMHLPVINYWLNSSVYPKELKDFPKRLRSSAWDLCSNNSKTTGFSGTNDFRLLLPLTVDYCPIKSLAGTNGSLIESLLLPENSQFFSLKPGLSSEEVLSLIAKNNTQLKLLLDVGALMLDLSNKELVTTWLKLRPDLEAGVFFDEGNELRVVDKKGRVTLFEMSPFKDHLESCVVYLDDSHTRGTDLKIPQGTIGAVTLTKGLTKDRLVQACLRMRMLGKGHQVSFYASHEVDVVIRKLSQNPGSLQVLQWTVGNTRDSLAEMFPQWAQQGLSFYKRLNFFESFLIDKDLNKYSVLCEDEEFRDIFKIYLKCRKITSMFQAISSERFKYLENIKDFGVFDFCFQRESEKILTVVQEFVGTRKVFTRLLDEEVEMEMEIELEQEIHKENANSAIPHNHQISKDLKTYLETGVVPLISSGFLHISKAFCQSSVESLFQPKAWSNRILVSNDFTRTVTKASFGDDFLRPPRWLCFNPNLADSSLVFISGFEASKMMKEFKQEKVCLALIMPRTRSDQALVFTRFEMNLPQKLIQQVAVFAGSLFLKKDEVNDYLDFLGYCPAPRTEEQELLFNQNFIKHSGYVEWINREIVFGEVKSFFLDNPDELVKKIAEIRNFGRLNKFAHFFEIFLRGRRPLNEKDEVQYKD